VGVRDLQVVRREARGAGGGHPLPSFWFHSFSFPRIISSKDLAQFHSVFLSHFSRPATVRLDASLWTRPQSRCRRARPHFSHHRLGAHLHRRKNRASLSPRDDPRLHPRRSRRNLHAPAQPARRLPALRNHQRTIPRVTSHELRGTSSGLSSNSGSSASPSTRSASPSASASPPSPTPPSSLAWAPSTP